MLFEDEEKVVEEVEETEENEEELVKEEQELEAGIVAGLEDVDTYAVLHRVLFRTKRKI